MHVPPRDSRTMESIAASFFPDHPVRVDEVILEEEEKLIFRVDELRDAVKSMSIQ